jgi:uncharacterized protein YlxW (UPF0749 family)
MTLLTEVMERPLDGGYAEASRRQAEGEGPIWWGRWAMVLTAALVLGLGVTWGVRALRSPGEEEQRTRAALERRAEDAQDRVTALRERTNDLSGEIESLQNQALSATDPAAAAQARSLAITVGAIPVTGWGLEITLREDSQAVAAGSDESRIRAGDLRIIVGSLWQSGAEAVAVGGVRLAATTAIRDVGDQIQVGFESLGTPYTIQALGPAEEMEIGLASGRAAQRISLLTGYFGAGVEVRQVKGLELPASAEAARLEYTYVGGGGDTQ